MTTSYSPSTSPPPGGAQQGNQFAGLPAVPAQSSVVRLAAGPASRTHPPGAGAGPQPPAPIRIGLCGASGGGKTTFLASLAIAVQDANNQPGQDWTITAADEASRDFLVGKEQELVYGRTFPPATEAENRYRLQVDGRLSPPAGGWRKLVGRRPAGQAISMLIDVEDRPGEQFLLDDGRIPMSEESLDRLADAQALVFLFDPLREMERGEVGKSNWLYFQRLVASLKMRLHQRGSGLRDGRLPHHLAVCVTKFDDPGVFLPTYQARMVNADTDDGRPHVPPERAKEFFDWLCSRLSAESSDASADQLRMLVNMAFDPARVRYYGTSSIGFWTGVDGEFDPNDFQNFDMVDGTLRVRGKIRPVNVLEPLVTIERRIRSRGW